MPAPEAQSKMKAEEREEIEERKGKSRPGLFHIQAKHAP